MKNALLPLATWLLLLDLFGPGALASCGHGTSLQKRKLGVVRRQDGSTAQTVEVSKFGYLATQGPTGWAGLTPENALCSTSATQSPIDITNTSTTLTQPGDLVLDFPAVQEAEFENLGTTIEVVMEGKGAKTTVGGKEFALKQFHFHSPSEHTIDGEYFPLEMHMVHEAADGAIAVIAAQFQLSETAGETTTLVSSATEKIGDISTPGRITKTGPLDFAPLVQALSTQPLHTYTGSLTTPPCAEGLTFFVTSQQLPLDVATFNRIKAVVGFNARFPQNTPGRGNLLSLASDTLVAEVANGTFAAPAASAANESVVAPPAAVPAEAATQAGDAALAGEAVIAPEQANASSDGFVNTTNGASAGKSVATVGEAVPAAGGTVADAPSVKTAGTSAGNSAGLIDGDTARIISSLTGLDLSNL